MNLSSLLYNMYIVTPPCNLGGWGCKITDESQSFLVSNPIFWGVAASLGATGCVCLGKRHTDSQCCSFYLCAFESLSVRRTRCVSQFSCTNCRWIHDGYETFPHCQDNPHNDRVVPCSYHVAPSLRYGVDLV